MEIKDLTGLYKEIKNVRYVILREAVKLFFESIAEEKLDYRYCDLGEKLKIWKAKDEISTKKLQEDLYVILGHQFTKKDSVDALINKIAIFLANNIDTFDLEKLISKKRRTKVENLWLRFFVRIAFAALELIEDKTTENDSIYIG